jgi:hypothetical protein
LVGCWFGSALNSPPAELQAAKLPPQPMVRIATPVLGYGLDNHTLAAARLKQPQATVQLHAPGVLTGQAPVAAQPRREQLLIDGPDKRQEQGGGRQTPSGGVVGERLASGRGSHAVADRPASQDRLSLRKTPWTLPLNSLLPRLAAALLWAPV